MTSENRSTELQEFLVQLSENSIDDVDFTDFISAASENGDTALHGANAILNGDTELAKELVKLGADEKFEVGSCGRRPIHFAVMMGNVELTKFMTKKGYVGQRDEDGFSPLCLAEIFGHQEIADYLREVRKRILEQGLRRAQRLASKD